MHVWDLCQLKQYPVVSQSSLGPSGQPIVSGAQWSAIVSRSHWSPYFLTGMLVLIGSLIAPLSEGTGQFKDWFVVYWKNSIKLVWHYQSVVWVTNQVCALHEIHSPSRRTWAKGEAQAQLCPRRRAPPSPVVLLEGLEIHCSSIIMDHAHLIPISIIYLIIANIICHNT